MRLKNCPILYHLLLTGEGGRVEHLVVCATHVGRFFEDQLCNLSNAIKSRDQSG